jgi:hypothetical protein
MGAELIHFLRKYVGFTAARYIDASILPIIVSIFIVPVIYSIVPDILFYQVFFCYFTWIIYGIYDEVYS